MKKNIYCIIATIVIGHCIEVKAWDPLGLKKFFNELSGRVDKLADKVDELADKHLPVVNQTSKDLGQNAGITAAKEVTKAVSVAALVYAAVKSVEKGTEIAETLEQKALKEKKASMGRSRLSAECCLDNCCLNNIDAPRTERGVPLPCGTIAAMLAMYAGGTVVDDKISDFNKYAPAPTQTRQEYEAEAKEKEKPKSKGWFW
ncbi:MAG: hypothetical protein P4L31_07785 [Candidatus Babeliales bacterium]|nr:hypothetical protein [Candidatus Babeliales bacterium]